MEGFKDHPFWVDFIQTYKKLPMLWDTKSKEYHNYHLKRKAYTKMLQKLREFVPNATLVTLKKRIACLRYSFRRELKKVKRSKELATCENDIYTPNLFYYEHLSFLEEQELMPLAKVGADAVEEMEQTQCNELVHRPANKRDEDAILSASWAAMFRKLDPRQQLYANKAIVEVLYQGALGNLNKCSCKTIESMVVCYT